ncbi:hypothetical protein S83_054810, partial [Arachis hypogaea]
YGCHCNFRHHFRSFFAIVAVVAMFLKKDVDGQISNYPNLPSKLLCLLHSVTLHRESEIKREGMRKRVSHIRWNRDEDLDKLLQIVGSFEHPRTWEAQFQSRIK